MNSIQTNIALQSVINDLSSQSAATAGQNIMVYGSNGLPVAKMPATPADMRETTYAALVTLRSQGGLVPGMWYRITDYVTTTVQENTRSAGHQFDIIVRADSNNVLNENAYATKHAGDTYFTNAGAKLEAWELKYCLSNDTTRFLWADSTNGKGVIYYMKDEANNECPYDFKNIQYRLYKTTDTSNNFNGYWAVDTIDQAFPDTVTIDENDYIYAYTFTYFDENDNVCDLTLSPFIEIDGSICNNKIRPCVDVDSGAFKLNHIVFNSEYNNFGTNGNIIEENCSFLTFGSYSSQNHIGLLNEFSSFAQNCSYNTFGQNCYNNTFGQGCFYNTFGQSCYSNTFRQSCQYNTFGHECQYNIFAQNCSYNTFGQNCYNNTFGQGCFYNTFGQNCYNNTFGTYCWHNTFGQNCNHNTFSKNYSHYIIIENGNQYISLTSAQTTSGSNILRNIKICQGVNNTTTTKTISHNTVNDTFLTEYKPTNSQVISV